MNKSPLIQLRSTNTSKRGEINIEFITVIGSLLIFGVMTSYLITVAKEVNSTVTQMNQVLSNVLVENKKCTEVALTIQKTVSQNSSSSLVQNQPEAIK